MEPTLDGLKQDIILSSKRGITILAAGVLVLLIVSLLSLFLQWSIWAWYCFAVWEPFFL